MSISITSRTSTIRWGIPWATELLRAVAERLRINARRGDYVGRIGGDEFAVMIKARNVSSEAQKLAVD